MNYLFKNCKAVITGSVTMWKYSDLQVLELGMNFLTAEDMSAILAVKLRKRLGFGMWARLHITGMHVEGKVNILIGSQID